jgi:small conductance mechanosensitive channel
LASLGIAGLAISFGAQSIIKDKINGLFILLENQYGIGDVVKIGGVSGVVEEVNLRSTVLRDIDGVVHYVPNGEINIASNLTKDYSRVNMNISVAYGEDLDRVMGVINRVCKKMADEERWREKILKVPQVLRVDVLGDSGVEIKILGDTRAGMQWDVMGELRKRIKSDFAQEVIEIGLPHRKVYFGTRRDKDQVS